jgi:hypothetical protein
MKEVVTGGGGDLRATPRSIWGQPRSLWDREELRARHDDLSSRYILEAH